MNVTRYITDMSLWRDIFYLVIAWESLCWNLNQSINLSTGQLDTLIPVTIRTTKNMLEKIIIKKGWPTHSVVSYFRDINNYSIRITLRSHGANLGRRVVHPTYYDFTAIWCVPDQNMCSVMNNILQWSTGRELWSRSGLHPRAALSRSLMSNPISPQWVMQKFSEHVPYSLICRKKNPLNPCSLCPLGVWTRHLD